jgi:hypothetical protein
MSKKEVKVDVGLYLNDVKEFFAFFCFQALDLEINRPGLVLLNGRL